MLAPDGVLAISSPNRDVYPPGNPHHLHEYVPEELRAALAAHFDHVELHRQHAWLASAVFDDEEAADDSMRERTDVRIAKGIGREPGSEPYTIALAGRAPLPESTSALVLGDLADTGLGAELERARAELAAAAGHRSPAARRRRHPARGARRQATRAPQRVRVGLVAADRAAATCQAPAPPLSQSARSSVSSSPRARA